jgi:hypothetical protein
LTLHPGAIGRTDSLERAMIDLPLDLAVDQLEDVAARCVNPLAGRRRHPGGQVRRAKVRSLRSQLDHHGIAAGVEAEQLAVRARKARW